jgi:hypothetical protein
MSIKNIAQEAFRSDSDQLFVPRLKYNFTLLLDLYNDSTREFQRVSSASAASYSVDSTIMNQYNHKRVVQTRLNYDPITVSFYDTYDNQWHALMQSYLGHYFNQGKGISLTPNEGNSTVVPNFETNFGFTPNAIRNFFPQIRIIQNGYRDQYRNTVLVNPIITSIQGDTLDYSDSQPVKYTVTFQPESIQVEDVPPR